MLRVCVCSTLSLECVHCSFARARVCVCVIIVQTSERMSKPLHDRIEGTDRRTLRLVVTALLAHSAPWQVAPERASRGWKLPDRRPPPPGSSPELFRPINEITARNGRDVGMAFGPRNILSFERDYSRFRDLTRGIASRYFYSTGKRSRRGERDNWPYA